MIDCEAQDHPRVVLRLSCCPSKCKEWIRDGDDCVFVHCEKNKNERDPTSACHHSSDGQICHEAFEPQVWPKWLRYLLFFETSPLDHSNGIGPVWNPCGCKYCGPTFRRSITITSFFFFGPICGCQFTPELFRTAAKLARSVCCFSGVICIIAQTVKSAYVRNYARRTFRHLVTLSHDQ